MGICAKRAVVGFGEQAGSSQWYRMKVTFAPVTLRRRPALRSRPDERGRVGRSYRSPLRSSTLMMDRTISNRSSKNLSMDCSVGGLGKRAGFPPDCPPGFLGGLPLVPKLRANRLMVAGADPGMRFDRLLRGCAHTPLHALERFPATLKVCCASALRIHHHRVGLDSNQRGMPAFGCFRGATPWHCRPPERRALYR